MDQRSRAAVEPTPALPASDRWALRMYRLSEQQPAARPVATAGLAGFRRPLGWCVDLWLLGISCNCLVDGFFPRLERVQGAGRFVTLGSLPQLQMPC